MKEPRAEEGGRWARRLTEVALQPALAWLLLAGCATACAFSLDGAVGRYLVVPLRLRLHLLAQELVLLAIPAVVLGVILAWATRACEGERGAGRGRFTLRLAFGAALASAALGAYLGAWFTFRSVGQFPDLRALLMAWSDAFLLLKHAVHVDAAGVALAILSSVALGIAWTMLAAAVGRAPRGVQVALPLLGAATFATALFLARAPVADLLPADARVIHPTAGVDMSGADFLAEARSTRSGPLLRLQSSLLEGARLPSLPVGRAALAQCELRPVVEVDAWLAGVDPAQARRWNVILIEIESLRPDQLMACGGPRSVLPTIDALAAESRVYLRHYTVASHSNYADLVPLSSQYPLRSPWYHVYPKTLPYPRVLIHDLLHARGYRTAVISSQDESWGGMENYLRSPGLDDLLDSRNHDGRTYVPQGDAGFEEFAGGLGRSGKLDDAVTVDRAIAWLEALEPQRPFCVYMNLQNSHVPYVTPASFKAPFPRPDASLRIGFNSIPRDRVAEVKDAYANSLAYIDAQIARLLAHLRATGTWDDTLVIVGGDNGEAFLEHGFSAHASAVFDEVMRVPLVIRAPGLEPGVDDRLAATLDIAPSVLHLLGLPPHPAFQGRHLFDPEATSERNVFLLAQTPLAHQQGVVRGRWKLIHDLRSDRRLLLDLLGDPGETRDVAPLHPDVVADLTARLEVWSTAQLAYHADPALMSRVHAPVVPD